MNFVKNHNQYGVEAKEIPCLTGYGEPTEETEGAVGCLYMDRHTGDIYKCTYAADGVYVWKGLGGTAEADGITLTDHITGATYSIFVTNGKLAMESVESPNGRDSITLTDNTTGAKYSVFVDNGKLTMEGV